ncbi:23S rRNA (uracil(1939)-C(5))-methyltransferase RlmD [bacterium]|jgi:23S rRNA (uracil1939-C5)-methyltransferase|nr:23S rRNA (uracil(1939)-C(5))-methyltransferase RlmD [bacterium]MBT6831673.1 23S rRNA (uracil(1939)-C(5))-methyltransferase RlmD [bacterium]MBT6996319.1 23S rRNA (uracil(1939)-C(5))-methyltransferase RlmD [bacterium]MBT7772997.1 23S rRNA (uracil(1939)-C(5))-methyltransferase RlmD [bacterium]
MKIEPGTVLDVEIVDLAFGGSGVAKVEDFVIFVDGGITGQRVRARIKKVKKRFAEAVAVEVLSRSKFEKIPDLQLVPGAPWITIPVEMQREIKKKQTVDLYKKFVQFDLETVWDEFVKSPQEFWYRNKMDFLFGIDADGNFALGSKKRGQFQIVESLEKPCGLFDEFFEKLVPEIRKFCEKTKLPPLDEKSAGFFESLVVRRSCVENKFLVEIVTAGTDAKFDPKLLADFLSKKMGERFGGIFHTQKIRTDSRHTEQKSTLILGSPKLREVLGGLEFEISRDSFFQPNPAAAAELYKKVVQFLDLKSGESVLDLFCGTGTIAQMVAKNFPNSRVIGVEIVESAVEDAKKNAEKNEIKNVTFACADVRKWLKAHNFSCVGKANRGTEVMVLDPPRAGIETKSLERIIERAPGKIIYVSCNPSTQARDAKILMAAGFRLEKFALVDQFPHTAHVETVAQFVRA